ncbi:MULTISPECIES: preprotein translocase subunit SecY [unclassified Imperialibacter]|jgi:preprotein translocase subunit SecY|uniref:preprotein translocase subunit SecY n=1 Tax=unclassified Imperialibacter TaxID=2629706 RepID=UPI00125823D1|nr:MULTISPECIES: preprotein translocase subunit SecY [unclassified Imperialibacter]CAD5254783.1 preprotein translocase membrane subunit [Imperialibacter sp. 75]CAD5263258.1 preprotein translocase membrane subunit [Imperialibacter sp. 89]VVT35429.1 preprotein translocase membrane subunit [Imperialibacter sp. EC-SDR9]|eukprot:TRINITY_DN11409_c0_g1_i2.p1 TRINITY_DN11409_c0_g1~~TRINITY_DN11409_c0_g1_i2.p1  ORF type:complete len:440 (-),score=-77.38 TRINITY_DN11409_c0_g1_i2:1791-3110(-)
MKRFISTIRNIFSIEDLRIRILNTVGFLLIFRLGSYIVLPGIDPSKLAGEAQGIFGLLDTFLGGAFSNASIFGLGIMPYISASIVLQLLTVAVPYFQRLQKEGDSGRKKINQYTRVLTIFITLAQGIGYLTATIPAEAIVMANRTFFTGSSIVILTAGTIFCMWLGEKITDKGIGNGISMLIMIGIVSRFPAAIIAESLSRGMSQGLILVLEIVALFFVVMAVVMLTQAVRRIPVQYAKQVVGNKVYGGQRQYIPLKVNAAGVMPIIFAQSLMFLPALIASIWADTSDMAQYIGTTFSDFQSWQYNALFASLIIIFTFFYTAITINPNQIGDDMKRNGGFIPGIKPGKATSEFIDGVLTRITLPGSLFLALVAIMPAFASMAGVTREFSQFYGGTSLLIMVGVILDTLQQIESYLLMRHYEGMMKSGRLKGRSQNVAVA